MSSCKTFKLLDVRFSHIAGHIWTFSEFSMSIAVFIKNSPETNFTYLRYMATDFTHLNHPLYSSTIHCLWSSKVSPRI